MASSLKLASFGSNFLALARNSLNRNEALAISGTYQQIRGKKKKASSSMTNKISKTKFKHDSPLRVDGQFVYQGEWLVRQRQLMWYPGENVGIQKNNNLYALRDGQLVVTYEKLSPYPDSPLYAAVHERRISIYKTFYNIYPIPVHAKFKLIS